MLPGSGPASGLAPEPTPPARCMPATSRTPALPWGLPTQPRVAHDFLVCHPVPESIGWFGSVIDWCNL